MTKLVGLIKNVDRSITVVNGVCFTEAIISVMRKSGVVDNIILMFNDDKFRVEEGSYVRVIGDVRTYKEENNGLKTRLKVLVKGIEKVDYDELDDEEKTLNYIDDHVIIVKANKMRRTPNKMRITDLKVGKFSSYGKFYTYTAITWGSNAKLLSEKPYGTKIHIIGRLQERSYIKKDDKTSRVLNTYEVSVSRVEME